MVMTRQIAFLIFIFLIVLGRNCLSKNLINHFQGTWINDYGNLNITHCKEMKCEINITTENGAYICDLKGKLTTLSDQEAIFQLKNLDADDDYKKRFVPINLSLTEQVITITIPEESLEASRGYCDLRGFFEGEYTNSNAPRIYKTSFNCKNAKTKIEFNICHSSELAHADLVLSQLYFQLKTRGANNIINQQKKWIKDRDTCSNSPDSKQCLLVKYCNRILTLQQESINSNSKSLKVNANIPYNYNYLLLLSKSPNTHLYEIYADPPLQKYLNTALPKDTVQKIMYSIFKQIETEYLDDSFIMIKGGVPELYTICEGAIVLTKNHQTWLAYININNQQKTQIIIFCPKNGELNKLPDSLDKWVNRLLPNMENKKIIYKRMLL